MTGRDFMKAPGMRYALMLLAVALVTTGWVTFKAYHGDVVGGPTSASAAKMQLTTTQPVQPIDVGAVVGTDPFEANRSAPKKIYRLPGDTDATVKPAPGAPGGPREPPKPTVAGTSINPTDSTKSFVTCQLGTGSPKQLYLGQKIGEFTLTTIGIRKVVFLNAAGQPVEVNVNR